MSKTRCLLLALGVSLAAVVSANAEAPKKFQIMPPVEYDHPYTGELTLRRAKSQAEIRSICPTVSFNLGVATACSIRRANSCMIAMAPDDEIRKTGMTPEIVLRHETAHCNGWGPDHKGARVWQIDWAEHETKPCGLAIQKPCGPEAELPPQKPWLGDPRIWEEAMRGTPVPQADPRKAAPPVFSSSRALGIQRSEP
jgi:hypothetical protein